MANLSFNSRPLGVALHIQVAQDPIQQVWALRCDECKASMLVSAPCSPMALEFYHRHEKHPYEYPPEELAHHYLELAAR